MSEMDEIVREFLVESNEGLDQLDRDLVALEQRPDDRDLLAAIFRCIHTIKGTCGFLGFGKLEAVAHVGENLLALLRDGKLRLDPSITDALLQLVDATRAMLSRIEAEGHEGDADYADLVALLTRLAGGGADHDAELAEYDALFAAKAAADAAQAAAPAVPAPPAASPVAPTPADTAAPARGAAPPAPAEGERGAGVAETSIRVDVGLLDRLMTLVGELVLARNQILQFTGVTEDNGLVAASQRLNLITTELQEGVMKTRMQPINNVWSKFPRVVRDLSHQLGKQVALELEGKETELDKTIIEAIKDPLTHIVRNSVDHGIERPEARVARGKPAEGTLRLKAYHEGGQVNIEIIDDGGGIDPAKVKAKAVAQGVVTPEQAARMGDREAQALIFAPGFSTAEQVTNVSGRGVGMDVVRTNIEKIGGSVDVASLVGHGTTLKIKIPLTLAIIPALTVRSGGERFCIPQVNLVELVRHEPGQNGLGIERIHGAPVYRLRGRLLPICFLHEELGLASARREGEAVNIVVLHADDRQFGLVVDEVQDTEEIVVKPLGEHLKEVPVFAGATIMGDGHVALILDVLGVAQRARMLGGERERARAEAAATASASAQAERASLLVFGVGADRRLAIPLSAVQRLEEVERAAVEWSGGQEVVQYRGEILPLVRLSSVLGVAAAADEGAPLQVVVYADQGRSVGLVVDVIHDIVEQDLSVEHPVRAGELLGTAVVQQKVTDLLDVAGVVRAACPWLFDAAPAAAGAHDA